MTYYIGTTAKVVVEKVSREDFRVRFFEFMGGRWVQLGADEHWRDLADIKWEYGID